MNRLFGKSKPKVAGPTLDDAAKSMEARGETVDTKVAKLDAELIKYKQQLAKMRPGPAKSQLSQRALRCLQQKKMYEKQKDSLMAQSFNIDQTKFAQENVRDTVLTVNAMKDAQKSLKKEMGAIKIDSIEDLHDDMSDLLEDADEINEIMGRSYGIPEELDETDLMNELEALEGELMDDEDQTINQSQSNEIPSYLVNAATQSRAVNQPTTQTQSNRSQDVILDEFGLPDVPQRSLQI